MTAPRTPTAAPISNHQLPGWFSRIIEVAPTATARMVAPKYPIRKAALALASALIPRIAVMAAMGPVRSSPRITKVENVYIIPPAAALARAASEVRITTGLVVMTRSQLVGRGTDHR